MSEPLQLVSFAEAVWQVYVTSSFPLPCSFCAEFYSNSNIHESLTFIAFCSYQPSLLRQTTQCIEMQRIFSMITLSL